MESNQAEKSNLVSDYIYDEDAKRACAEALQILLKDREEKYKRNTAQAIAEGFSSMEEKEQHSMNEFDKAEKRHEEWMREQAVLIGKTFEEFEKEYWAPQQFVPTLPDCNCDTHPIPFFCTKSLIEYSSQKLALELPNFIKNRHHVPIEELKIKPGDPSRRLAHTTLEREWARTPITSCELPIWAKGDKILQQAIHPSSLCDTQHGGSRGNSLPSLSFTVSRHDADTALSINTPTGPGHNSGQQVPTLSGSQKTGLGLDIKNVPKRRRRESLHRFGQRSGKIAKPLKRFGPPATRTRSRKVMKFYELGQDGAVTRSRGF